MKSYQEIYETKQKNEAEIKRIQPLITNNSGIYVFHRLDETGIKFCYCGQALHLRERCASHLSEYDRLALSLKTRGFCDVNNPYGWKLAFREYPREELDERETATIRNLANDGFQLLNVTSGGQGKGKKKIGEYKPSRTYREGVQQGKLALARDLKAIMDKHLTVTLKPEKTANKVSQRMFEKFMELLNEENYREVTENE